MSARPTPDRGESFRRASPGLGAGWSFADDYHDDDTVELTLSAAQIRALSQEGQEVFAGLNAVAPDSAAAHASQSPGTPSGKASLAPKPGSMPETAQPAYADQTPRAGSSRPSAPPLMPAPARVQPASAPQPVMTAQPSVAAEPTSAVQPTSAPRPATTPVAPIGALAAVVAIFGLGAVIYRTTSQPDSPTRVAPPPTAIASQRSQAQPLQPQLGQLATGTRGLTAAQTWIAAPASSIGQPSAIARTAVMEPGSKEAQTTANLAADDAANSPVKFRNPFDSSEVFEFPSGTSQAEAKQMVAVVLLERGRERRSHLRPERKHAGTRLSGTSRTFNQRADYAQNPSRSPR